MKRSGIFVTIFSLVVLAGGIIGFLKANSMPSLVMGILFSVGLVASGWAMLRGMRVGLYTATTLTFVLGVFFIFRFFNTYKVMPAGLMSVLSVIVLAILLCNFCCTKCAKTKV